MNPPPGTSGVAHGQSGDVPFRVTLSEPHRLYWPDPPGLEMEWHEASGSWRALDGGVLHTAHFDFPEDGEFVFFVLDGQTPVEYGTYST